MRKVSGLEAVYRDYAPKGVKFFFVYKALAHPERNGILQPVTLDERLVQAREATKRLGNTIPFLVDAIDNRLKHALGDRNNSEFIIDPRGKIVRKRTWSDPDAVRKDLEEFVGKVDKVTKPEDIVLKVVESPPDAAAKGVVQKVARTGMSPLHAWPQMEKDGPPFYAKLRAEAEAAVIEQGRGKLYLGFHLDPFHKVHWNNLRKPLRYELEVPEGVKLSAKGGEGQRPRVEKDIDPREFMLDVEAWPEGNTVRLTVTYAACTDDACHEVRQTYELRRQLDRDGGRATSGAGGFRGRTPEEALKRLLEGDKNADGKLTKEELSTFLQSRFPEFDANRDGILDQDELRKMAEALTQKKQ
jgi:hypothetical protein